MSIISDSNWSEVRQSIINEVRATGKKLINKGQKDVVSRLMDRGISEEQIEIVGNKVIFHPKSDEELEHGKIYFGDIAQEINNPIWLESLRGDS